MLRAFHIFEAVFAYVARFVIGTGFAFFMVIGFHIGYLQLMPMSHWVEFENVSLDRNPQGNFLAIRRTVQPRLGSITVTAYTEMYMVMTFGGESIPGCSSRVQTQSEVETGKVVRAPLSRLMPFCNLPALDGKKVELQFVAEIDLPYTIRKRKRFLVGPIIFHYVEGE